MDPQLANAAKRIREGGLVAFPTETVYGLGASALDEKAVRGIFEAKGRPADNPCIVHVVDEAQLREVVREIPRDARALMRAFWPGPLTILFPRGAKVPDAVTAGLPTVAVRMPAHPVARALIEAAGVPIAAPSANRSGRPSPTRAAHVREDFPGMLVLEGGDAEHGLESTVVALSPSPRVLREGAIPLERLREVLPRMGAASSRKDDASSAPQSPGLKYRHYAPSRPLTLFMPSAKEKMARYARAHPDAIVLCADRHAGLFPRGRVVRLGRTGEEIARSLFAALRTKEKGDELIALGIMRRGHGRAVMDRLERAAEKIVRQ